MAGDVSGGYAPAPRWTDWCGAAAAVGGVVWTTTPWLTVLVLGDRPYAATPFDPLLLFGWALMGAGLAGLHATLRDRYGTLGRVAVATTAVGMVLVAGLLVRSVVALASAGFRPVPATGEDLLVLLAAYGGYGLALLGAGLVGIALWRLDDRPTTTALLLVLAAVTPVVVLDPLGVVPAGVGSLLVRANGLLVPFGVAWVALGAFVHSAARRDGASE